MRKLNDTVFWASFFSVIAVVIHFLHLMGWVSSWFFLWLVFKIPATFAVVLWLAVLISGVIKKKYRKVFAALGVMAAVVLVHFIWIDGLRYKLMPQKYENSAQQCYDYAMSENLPEYTVYKERDILGHTTIYKNDEDIMIYYDERSSISQIYAFARCFGDKDPVELVGAEKIIEDFGNGWYYIKLC